MAVGGEELLRNASRDHAEAGETIEITERGQLVAVLGPPTPGHEAREALIAAGVLRPGRGGLAGWQPGRGLPDVPPLSAVLAELRDEDDR